jgi:hypothetical protein
MTGREMWFCSVIWGVACLAWGASPDGMKDFVLTDQFDQEHTLADHRGEILVLVYGDRKGTEASRKLGEWLHVEFHPTAANLPPAEGAKAPVRPRGDGSPGRAVQVVPVACTGKVPKPLQRVVRQQFRKGAPDVAVWLDFDEELAHRYGLESGVPHLAIFNHEGELQHHSAGLLGPEELRTIVKHIEGLR